jgi:cell division protein FtsB
MRSVLERWGREVAYVLGALALIVGVQLWSRDGDKAARSASLRTELERLESRNQTLRIENDALKAEIARLRVDERESLSHARTELGMVRPGELVYQFRAQEPTTAVSAPATGSLELPR